MKDNELVPFSKAIGKYDSIGNLSMLESASMHRNDENWKFLAFNIASSTTPNSSSPCLTQSKAASDKHIANTFFKLLRAPALCCFESGDAKYKMLNCNRAQCL